MISLCTHLFLVTRAAWERFEFLIKRVGDSRFFPFPSRIFNYALLPMGLLIFGFNVKLWTIVLFVNRTQICVPQFTTIIIFTTRSELASLAPSLRLRICTYAHAHIQSSPQATPPIVIEGCGLRDQRVYVAATCILLRSIS